VAKVTALLAKPIRIRENARHNYEIAKGRLSYRVLRRKLRREMEAVIEAAGAPSSPS
jgi:hypothetical protein